MRALTAAFAQAMDCLADVPLSSVAIRAHWQVAQAEWGRLSARLDDLAQSAALAEVADVSERLLHSVERLTDEYERAMQILIGDDLRRLA